MNRNTRRPVRRVARLATRDTAPPALSLRPGSLLFIAHTQPGLESVCWSEIEKKGGKRLIATRHVPARNGLVFFTAQNAAKLAGIRTAEDLFMLAGYDAAISSDKSGLEQARTVAGVAPYVDAALQARVLLKKGSRAGRRLGFKVVARVAGRQEFRRVDFQRAIERGIAERGDHSWRSAGLESAVDVEFWATLLGEELLLAVRLTGDELRQREYKSASFPGSLRPSVAAAMAVLSSPKDDDVFLDPMCGAGTILIERAHLGRYRMLLGGDSSTEVLAAATENIGPRYKPIELRLLDAQALPYAPGSVSKIVTNLPWGRKSGNSEENRNLYPRVIKEFARVLAPSGTIVLLTAEGRQAHRLLERSGFLVRKILRVSVLGAPAEIFVCGAPRDSGAGFET